MFLTEHVTWRCAAAGPGGRDVLGVVDADGAVLDRGLAPKPDFQRTSTTTEQQRSIKKHQYRKKTSKQPRWPVRSSVAASACRPRTRRPPRSWLCSFSLEYCAAHFQYLPPCGAPHSAVTRPATRTPPCSPPHLPAGGRAVGWQGGGFRKPHLARPEGVEGRNGGGVGSLDT